MARGGRTGAQHDGRDGLPAGQEDTGEVDACVGRGVEFKGTIIYHGTVRIDGVMEGEIHTGGCLLVGDGAVVTAKVSAGVIISKGTITGDVVASERVQLLAPATLNGSLGTPVISMEEGVGFNGTVKMTSGGEEPADPRERSDTRAGTVGPTRGNGRSGKGERGHDLDPAYAHPARPPAPMETRSES